MDQLNLIELKKDELQEAEGGLDAQFSLCPADPIALPTIY